MVMPRFRVLLQRSTFYEVIVEAPDDDVAEEVGWRMVDRGEGESLGSTDLSTIGAFPLS